MEHDKFDIENELRESRPKPRGEFASALADQVRSHPTERTRLGRIGVAISPVNPDVVYANVEAANAKGGIFRSEDNGVTWTKHAGNPVLTPTPGSAFDSIYNSSQSVIREFFTMIMMVDLSGAAVTFEELRSRLTRKGQELGVRVEIQREEIFKSMHRI